MNKPLQAVIFDMDGLIFDTEVIHRESWKAAANEYEVTLSDDFFKRAMSLSGHKTWTLLEEFLGADFPVKELHQRKRAIFKTKVQSQDIQIKPGFESLFDWLTSLPVKLGLVTSSRQEDVDHNFSNLDCLQHLDTVITSEQITNSKPDPEPYQKACQQLDVEPGRTIVFEDSNNGCRSAIAAGCNAIMVPDFAGPDPDVESGALAILDSLEQAKPFLLKQQFSQ